VSIGVKGTLKHLELSRIRKKKLIITSVLQGDEKENMINRITES